MFIIWREILNILKEGESEGKRERERMFVKKRVCK